MNVAIETGVAPRAGTIIDTHWFICLDLAVEGLDGREFDFTHGHADIGVDLPRDVNAFALGSRCAGFAAVPFERIFGRNHMFVTRVGCRVT